MKQKVFHFPVVYFNLMVFRRMKLLLKLKFMNKKNKTCVGKGAKSKFFFYKTVISFETRAVPLFLWIFSNMFNVSILLNNIYAVKYRKKMERVHVVIGMERKKNSRQDFFSIMIPLCNVVTLVEYKGIPRHLLHKLD